MPKEVRAKKSLGQHFLTDLNIAHRIADTISSANLEGTPYGDLPILEIGPGMGVLTRFLAESGRKLKAVELDSESVGYLASAMPGLEVIEADFLRLDLNEIYDGKPFALIGNYPYNISSQIFFKVLDYKELIPVAAGMLQREVAQRLCSPPGSKTYGILSVLLQAWYDCEYLFTVDENVFSPPPKVKSGVIRLVRNSRRELGVDEKLFKQVVKTAFGQRRKTLRNSLGPVIPPGSPLWEDEILKERPERLGVEEFIRLTRMIEEGR
ncbi:MAG: 16S rRNA (adenine(1518)-N(6)/adenine(1519)-N(6))-dimethyltransferase RsmA [Bacteroidales bacterium]|nr:16S rRNA (adenine(1518)-N(6)/adenine(1519)-N(6))-dimethyltransferase RsmA [Bacteroidales bacterium]MBD5221698.1 16S rRNA (adenine(1518)-N(6)/adenine(1519)-N(6))-dimethyltransferase RsmA [Bacteroidales bacterium]